MSIIPRDMDNPPSPTVELSELERQKMAFLEQGGTIKVLPPCAYTERRLSQQFRISRPEARK